MDSHTISTLNRLEVVDTGQRRRWSEEEKARIVLESLSEPRLVAATARRGAEGDFSSQRELTKLVEPSVSLLALTTTVQPSRSPVATQLILMQSNIAIISNLRLSFKRLI